MTGGQPFVCRPDVPVVYTKGLYTSIVAMTDIGQFKSRTNTFSNLLFIAWVTLYLVLVCGGAFIPPPPAPVTRIGWKSHLKWWRGVRSYYCGSVTD